MIPIFLNISLRGKPLDISFVRRSTRKVVFSLVTNICLCLFFILFGLGSISNASSSKKTDWERDALVGAVQRVVERTYSPDATKSIMVITSHYDRKGKKIELDISFLDKEKAERNHESRFIISYDDNDRPVEQKGYSDDGRLTSRDVYAYDAQGKLIERVSYASDGSEGKKWLYAYDNRGNKKEEKYYLLGNLKQRLVNDYDDRGNLSKTTTYRNDGSLQDTTFYKYDNENRLNEITYFSPDDIMQSRHVYMYSGKSRLLTEDVSYGTEGLMKSREVYSYENDKKGNWIKRTVSKWTMEFGKPRLESTQITERAITYYK